jgi:hypothetical protein
MNALQKMIDEAKQEHDAMWAVAIAAEVKGLATLEGGKGAKLTRENLVDL